MRHQHSTAGPRRIRFGRFRNVSIALLPDAELETYGALVCPGPLRDALLRELQIREGSDRSGLRAWSPAWGSV